MTIKLLLVDDQNLVKMGICSLLQLSGRIDVVAQLDDGVDVLAAIEKYQPDIMLLDIRMPRKSGLEVMSDMQARQIKVPTLVLTTFDEHDLVLDCMKFGAKGYLRKDVSLETLLDAIDTLVAGGEWIQPAITKQIWDNKATTRPHNEGLVEALTRSELQVLRLVAAGYSNYEIAEALHKSAGTVRNLVSSVLSKLQVRDRTRAALKAMELGLI